MSAEPLLACRGISKTYRPPSGAIEALRSVDLELPPGGITAVVGASGSGKSTLLRVLAALDRPTAGRLLFDGYDIAAASAAALRQHRRRGATYVAQRASDNFVPHLTLRQHADDTHADAIQLLQEFGIGNRLDAKPIELSGGEQARAAFALALARRTPLVVVDEPTAELDRATAALLLDAMQRHTAAGIAFAVATHDRDVTAAANHVVRLDRGRIITAAPPQAPAPRRPRAPDAGPELLAARNLHKRFTRGRDTITAVRHAELGLRPGEIGILLGRSGSGKSTLLTLLAGWQPADTGEISWHGRPSDPSRLPWSQLSYVPQRFGLLPELTIRDNIEYPARLAGTLDGLRPRTDELLAELGLDELAARTPAETSIGQQQRTALARALLLQPRLLLADEPTSHQDAAHRDRVWQQLAAAADNGTACLIATHEDDAAAYATRLWQISDGTTTPDLHAVHDRP